MLHQVITEVTERIIERSHAARKAYLTRMQQAETEGPQRRYASCSNLAHTSAACDKAGKEALHGDSVPNIAIVSAYNDMLSAHQPYKDFPEIIKQAAENAGGIAQFAGGVPAMCDGITQGQSGMELSLFSRDTIAMATTIALSHNVFDGVLCLGICDKIVPGLLIAAASFGHLPVIFVPSGPMPSGLPNAEKQRIRQEFATGKVGRDALLASESASYHAPGTCTFYGTANSNQIIVEALGVQLPGSSFVPPNTKLRHALTTYATELSIHNSSLKGTSRPFYRIIDERSIVNAIIALLATGGSTNHTIHLIAIARANGIQINWDDFAALSHVIPLLTHIYPSGTADINHFHAAGGTGLLIRELLNAGLMHNDVNTIVGQGLERYTQEPYLEGDVLAWRNSPTESGDATVIASAAAPFSDTGGLALVEGNLGRAVVKISAVKPEYHSITAPARVFHNQDDFQQAFEKGELHNDFVAVITFQGPKANGMPELHKLMPALGVLQDLGYRVALVTDGRLSGASGKVLSAIHVTPECVSGGNLAKLQDGDMIHIDAEKGVLRVDVTDEELASRTAATPDISAHHHGIGRELFHHARQQVSSAEEGASFILFAPEKAS